MTPEQFCYWIQGLLEYRGDRMLTESELKGIKDHLDTVFTKITPVDLGKEKVKEALSSFNRRKNTGSSDLLC